VCLVAASNEAPEDEELGALYDRFLLRRNVLALSDEGGEAMIQTLMHHTPCTMHQTP
jgi:hypothetical protein